MIKIWNWIKQDGLLHIESSALIVVIFGLFLQWWIAGIISLATGIGKELWDIKHGVPTWHDIICDIIGVIIGIFIVLIGIWS